MDDVTLSWATVVCSKSAPTARNPHRRISNTYDIALDASQVWGQKFECPCCGEELHIEVAEKGDIPKELRREIIDERKEETREHFKTFAGVSVFLLAAMAARVFVAEGASSVELIFTVMALFIFALIWLPYFIFMVWTSRLTSSGVSILRDFEKKHPGEIVILFEKGNSDCSHRLEEVPESSEGIAAGYRLSEQI